MNKSPKRQSREMRIAQSIRSACIDAAREGFQDASMSGLCIEGAMEAAVSSIQSLNLEKIISETNNHGE